MPEIQSETALDQIIHVKMIPLVQSIITEMEQSQEEDQNENLAEKVMKKAKD